MNRSFSTSPTHTPVLQRRSCAQAAPPLFHRNVNLPRRSRCPLAHSSDPIRRQPLPLRSKLTPAIQTP
jgi:hypothetical protein